MRGLLSLFRLRMSIGLQYRVPALAGVFTQIFFGLVMVMVYVAFFDSADGVMPMSLKQTITYIWLGQGMLALIPWTADREVQQMIRKGDVAYELVRPVSLYWFWYFRFTAIRLSNFILRSVPLFLFVRFLLPEAIRIKGPLSMAHFLAFIAAMVGAIILGTACSNIVTITTLFVIGDGMDRLYPAVIMFFARLTIPLSFFPEWSQTFMRIQPFSGLMDTPYKLYLGIYEPGMLPGLLLHQILWTLFFIALGQWLLSMASRRIVVQGG